MALIASQRDIAFICGMHRSGTSYLAEQLGEMGLQLPITAKISSPLNPRGYFEPAAIQETHNSVLKRLGLAWDSEETLLISLLNADRFPETIEQLKTDLLKEFPSEKPIVLKDPRLCLFLPIWQRLVKNLGVNSCYILTFRHPFAVSKSLERRAEVKKVRTHSHENLCRLWMTYLLESEFHTREQRRTFVEFPHWAEHCEDSLRKIQSDLNIKFPDPTGWKRIDTNFKPELVHFNSENQSKEFEIAGKVYHLFQLLIEEPYHKEAMAQLDQYRTRLAEECLFLTAKRLGSLAEESARVSKESARVSRNSARVSEESAQLNNTLAQIHASRTWKVASILRRAIHPFKRLFRL